MTGEGFGGRYRAAVAGRGRLCAGIDPHPSLLEQWGLPVTADGLAAFADACVAGIAPVAAVIKPQVAFFEMFGAAGFAVLERVISGCREAGALVVADAKRGDIGSTMAAYSTAWLDEASPLCSDAVTVSPYLGFGSLAPAVEQAAATGRAVFALARTSNPEGARVQTADSAGRSVAQSIVDDAARVNTAGSGTVGVVVGATRDHGLDLSTLSGPVLAPGLGAQGATAADLARIFVDCDPTWILPAASRSILRAGPDPAALAAAVAVTRDEIEAAL
ncbi:orotidine-5'-phosphate decarboxylase [Gordonia shandongensis]|uniref:orotidine-5'-phosphate decarboxylase n=1 Tax=Gordonia shandongensis TaxID=376351 RepID=UPI00040972EB|nr:orotidine-5'-phosphate decarboxylase [Gordonia shandongensis]